MSQSIDGTPWSFLSPAGYLAGIVAVLAVMMTVTQARAEQIRIVALGDSLTAGYQLEQSDAFPAKLETALRRRGHDVTVVNAGVSGDTTSGGLARADWSVDAETDAVILELGANDALRGISPHTTRNNLDDMLTRFGKRGIAVLLAGMYAPPNMGKDYQARFNIIFPFLAEKHGALLYPFFLDGVAGKRRLNLADGMHPNPAGIDVIVERILPAVEQLIGRITRGS